MNTKKQGFTLIEMLIVITILSTLAAIIFPVFESVRRNARQAVSISNLKQCGMALLMYCDDYNGPEDIPDGDVAANLVLKKMPTCDPNDNWRSNCTVDYGEPLIGSYAYVNNFCLDNNTLCESSSHEKWAALLPYSNNPALLSSIFYADPVPTPFHGLSRNFTQAGLTGCGPSLSGCHMPDRALEFRLDGSVKMVKTDYPYPDQTIFDWAGVFYSAS